MQHCLGVWILGTSLFTFLRIATCHFVAPSKVEAQSSAIETATSLNRGAELYLNYCAVCHGNKGRGDGASAYLLSPAPRDFGSTRFRLVSTVNRVPSEEDLLQVLRRGMPGSAMPAWEWMAESDLVALVQYVRTLSMEGRADDIQAQAARDDEELTREEALEIATVAMTPGAPIAVPPECDGTPIDIQIGRRYFLENCALCHGADGTGKGGTPQVNEDGTPAYPRDFTAGVLKGGASHTEIVRRITAGLPGSPMPATDFKDQRLASQVSAYVRSLIKPGVQERVVQTRRRLIARRASGSLPTTAVAEAWAQAEPAWLPLMHLWWRNQRIDGCTVRALHDGRKLTLKISWEDATESTELLATEFFTDAFALQWAQGPQPPLFTMGAAGQPVNIWLWRAGWQLDLSTVQDVASYRPNMPSDIHGTVDPESAALYLTARAVGNPLSVESRTSPAEILTASGFGTLAPLAGAAAGLRAVGSWSNGFWDLVMTRPMNSSAPTELGLEPGADIFVAAAAWDGAYLDRNGQKCVSVWHVMHIEE